MSAYLDNYRWYDDKQFNATEAKKLKFNSSVSLYDLIRLRPEEAEKHLTITEYLRFAQTNWEEWSVLHHRTKKNVVSQHQPNSRRASQGPVNENRPVVFLEIDDVVLDLQDVFLKSRPVACVEVMQRWRYKRKHDVRQ
ncbi:unnamed protein product [Trichogramma brassicae]|uniref:Uncharacterized protein n=1 Tax=Trichogramma brassicae TaxID=86971 RepID=A0A6H5J0H6_9HYME|nr:unnamed protein product [Trichogramma brassicae]